MKELQNFRRFLNEEIMRGDTVVLKGDDTKMKVMSVRDMFASDLKAYVVKNLPKVKLYKPQNQKECDETIKLIIGSRKKRQDVNIENVK